MAVNFPVNWDNSELVASSNATQQVVQYRRKSVGGSFITAGFTPSNPMAKTVNSATSPSLLDNVIYEFEIITTCTLNTGTVNSNGIQEAINFACILPTFVVTTTTATATINVASTDITKARLTLKLTSDNSIKYSAILNKIGTTIAATVTGLTASTAYYWEVNLYAIVQGVEVMSTICSPYPTTTTS